MLPEINLCLAIARELFPVDAIDAVLATEILAAVRRRQNLFLAEARRALTQRNPGLLCQLHR
jgi:hypothetical protein